MNTATALTLSSATSQLIKAGFDQYGSFNEVDLQHEIYTCLEGKYNGEVVDIYWNYKTGAIQSIEYSTQFKGQEAIFRLK